MSTSFVMAGALPRFSRLSAQFVLSACRGPDGALWFGTEGHGLFRYLAKPRDEKRWSQFTRADGLADNTADAAAVDGRGRIWVGSLAHGVSVYNGKCWQRYGLLTRPNKNETAGPIGEHVYSITECRIDGSVWICTNSGITRYEPGYTSPAGRVRGNWAYYTIACGLTSNDVLSVAFGPRGRAYVATRFAGLCIARPTGKYRRAIRNGKLFGPIHYATWRYAATPYVRRIPLTPTGSGLPSNLINGILVSRSGTVWVATDEGLGWSTDHGRVWRFVRGADWLAKDRQLDRPPAAQLIIGAAESAPRTGLLSEDYCTSLAGDANGDIWIGHRQADVDVLNPKTGRIATISSAFGATRSWKQPHKFVDGILLPPDGRPVLCFYGGGVCRLPRCARGTSGSFTRLPSTAMPAPADCQINAAPPNVNQSIAAIARKLWRDRAPPEIVPLDNDWRTRGNWLGRYGGYYAILCAMKSPADLRWGAGWHGNRLGYRALIGPHVTRQLKLEASGDSLRHWIQWLYTGDPRALEMPAPFMNKCWLTGLAPNIFNNRREAEWDDHGEAYPQAWQGPGIFIFVHVPPGLYILGLYNVNKDGHAATNRFRDFTVQIRIPPGQKGNLAEENLRGFDRWPVVGRARVCQFWSGVWTRFLVHGPMTICVKLGRNYSFNTTLSAVTLGLYNQRPDIYFSTVSVKARYSYPYQESPPRGKRTGVPNRALNDPHILNLGFGMKQRLPGTLAATIADAEFGTAAEANRLRRADRAPGLSRSRDLWQLHRFRQWEALQSGMGYVTARHIEQSLRWTGSGVVDTAGIYYVAAYVRAHRVLQTDHRASTEKGAKK